MNRLPLALKLLWRELRAGEVAILFWALVVAVACSTTVTLFSDRLQQTLTLQTAEFLAADLAIASHAQIPAAWLDKADELGLTHTKTLEFSSVMVEREEMLLTSVKAVSDRYPLRGQLKASSAGPGAAAVFHQGPATGTVWVDRRVLATLKLALGDSLTVGDLPLTITHELLYEPDKQINLHSLSPRVLMNGGDLAATHLLQPGSHVHYFFQFIGTTEALQAFKTWVSPQLIPPQRLLDIHNDRPELGSALDKARRYLGLTSTVVMLIAGVAIAMATRRFSERHFDQTALLRCLGCRQHEILVLYLVQFAALGLFASGLGCGLGWASHHGLFYLVREWLPNQSATASWTALFSGFAVGLLVLLGFALPPLLRLKNVPPLRVLRRELEPLPASAWLVYGVALGLIGLMIWRYTDDAALTATLLGIGSAGLAVLGLAVYALLAALKPLPIKHPSWRFASQALLRNRTASVSQILAFSVTLLAMILCFTVRNDLLAAWQQQLPKDAPNHFVLNIFADQLPAFRQELAEHGIPGNRIYSVVRGRLTEVNHAPVKERVHKDSQGENATQRELSLTWTDSIPDGNLVTAGQWWANGQRGQVSVEQKLAASLGLGIGDQLGFVIGGIPLSATVANIRSLHWDSLKPNFMMVFSPGTLDAFPATYLTSFYVAPENKPFMNALVKKFPNLTLMEVEAIVRQVQTIVSQLATAITYLLVFALLAGVAVLFAAVSATSGSRRQEGALLRTLGAGRRLLQRSQALEFGLLGWVSGWVAVLLAEAVLFVLYTRLLDMPYHPNGWLWLWMPLSSALLVSALGRFSLRGVLDKPPLTILRKS